MAQFIHSTQSEISGPFLIDRAQLESLDETLDAEWERLGAEQKKDIDLLLKQSKVQGLTPEKEGRIQADIDARSESKESREYFLLLKGGIYAKVATFKEAMREPDLQDKEPIGLSVSMERGARKCNVFLNHKVCRIEVGPKRDQIAEQSLVVLRNWQSAIRPPFWQVLWKEAALMHWVFYLFLVGILFVFISPDYLSQQVSGEVQQLALSTNALSADQQGRAVQLLLIKEYSLRNSGGKLPGWFMFLLYAGVPYCIALSFYPKVAIAIGAGEPKVQFWRRYATFIMITAPAFVFVTFLWPKIEEIVRAIF